jgi:hypothetical protein
VEGIEGVVVAPLVLLTWPISRTVLRNWGSDRSERERDWPGDRFAPAEHETYTRAITVHASAAVVWPWIVQFGLGRAGFYSYELLERIVGIPVTNVESLVPDWQSLATGDEIRLHPSAPGIPVGALEPERHVCFGVSGETGAPPATDPPRSWSIYVEPAEAGSCRLVLRSCVGRGGGRSVFARLGAALEVPIDFVMEQRMLRTIRRLAEAPSATG